MFSWQYDDRLEKCENSDDISKLLKEAFTCSHSPEKITLYKRVISPGIPSLYRFEIEDALCRNCYHTQYDKMVPY